MFPTRRLLNDFNFFFMIQKLFFATKNPLLGYKKLSLFMDIDILQILGRKILQTFYLISLVVAFQSQQ